MPDAYRALRKEQQMNEETQIAGVIIPGVDDDEVAGVIVGDDDGGEVAVANRDLIPCF
jgi:hypothetical protein